MLVSATLAAALIGAHPHANAACDAAALFRDVRAHTGGARWDAAKELVADGTVVSEGLPGRTRIATDLGSGATSTADDQDIVKTRLVSSASATWKQDLTGGVHPLDAPGARAAARTSAYLARNGYFRPATDPASFACLPDVTEDGRTLRRVRITPRGGRPAAVWVDPAAHVVVRTQEQAPTYLSTTHYGAYRQDAGLLLPHEIVETSGSTENTVVRSIRAYRVQRTVTAADFMRPPDSANQRIRTGATSTEVPIELGRGITVVNAFVNGHGPLPFILDTGGHAILTTDAARELGLTARGGGVSGGGGEGSITEQYARVQSLRIGDAEITDFPMFVIPFGKGLYGPRPRQDADGGHPRPRDLRALRGDARLRAPRAAPADAAELHAAQRRRRGAADVPRRHAARVRRRRRSARPVRHRLGQQRDDPALRRLPAPSRLFPALRTGRGAAEQRRGRPGAAKRRSACASSSSAASRCTTS